MEKKTETPKAAMSAREAADYMGMSKSALDKSRITGELFGMTPPEFIRYGRAVRYPVESLNIWLEQMPKHKTLAESIAS